MAHDLSNRVVHFYTTDKASQVTGATLRQLQYWREQKIVVPAIDEAGRGRSVYYSYENLLDLMVLRYLLRQDLTFVRARKTLKGIREWGSGSLANVGESRFLLTRLVGESSLGVVLWTDENVAKAVDGQRLIVFVSLEGLERALRKRLNSLKLEAPAALFLSPEAH